MRRFLVWPLVLLLTSGALALVADAAWQNASPDQLRSHAALVSEATSPHDQLVDVGLTPMAAIAATEARMVLVREGAAQARYDTFCRRAPLTAQRYGSPACGRTALLDTGCRTLYRLGILLQT